MWSAFITLMRGAASLFGLTRSARYVKQEFKKYVLTADNIYKEAAVCSRRPQYLNEMRSCSSCGKPLGCPLSFTFTRTAFWLLYKVNSLYFIDLLYYYFWCPW